jgi:hypothetical protein
VSILERISRHWRAGTLGQALRLRGAPGANARHPFWSGRQDPAAAARGLALRARELLREAPAGSWVLTLGDGSGAHASTNRWLEAFAVPFRSHSLEDVVSWQAQPSGLAAVLCAYADTRRATECVQALVRHPALAPMPCELLLGVSEEIRIFDRRDEYGDTFFVSPSVRDRPSPYDLYEESLRHFAQKCGLRDFLDLYQLLKGVVRRGIAGAVAEFGSYEGHSGWLMARTLQALGSDKDVFLFDTFEEFPEESLGVDRLWNRTHRVDYDTVRGKFADMPRVHLVRGDFTQTLATACPPVLALAHVDCDSYRATRHLLEQLPPRVSSGGVIACEDYGHPALIGHRVAVHECLDPNTADVQFFSQFSGLFIVIRR